MPAYIKACLNFTAGQLHQNSVDGMGYSLLCFFKIIRHSITERYTGFDNQYVYKVIHAIYIYHATITIYHSLIAIYFVYC